MTTWRGNARRDAVLIVAGVVVCAVGVAVSGCGSTSKRPLSGPLSARSSNGGLPEPSARARSAVEKARRIEGLLASLTERTPESKAMGARLLRELYAAQLLSWKVFYERKLGGSVREVWRSTADGGRSLVALEYSGVASRASSGKAEWAIRSASSLEEADGVSPNKLVLPRNALARRLQGFPPVRAGANYPVLIYAFEISNLNRRTAVVALATHQEYQPLMFVTAGGFDEALLRGYDMGEEPVTRPPRPDYLTLARGAAVYRGTIAHGRIAAVKPTSVKVLRESFSRGIVPLLVGWRHGAPKVSELLARPVQTFIMLEP